MSMSHKIAVALFALMITMPFIGEHAIHGGNDDKVIASEKRKVTPYPEMPAFKKRAVKEYFQNLDRYIADRLMYKDDLVLGISRLTGDPELFFEMDIDNGVIGQDGYVFLGNRHGQVLERHFRMVYEPPMQELENFVRRQVELKDVASSVGAAYMLFAAPDKHGIYCELFPRQLADRDACDHSDRITRMVAAKLQREGVAVSYPREILREHRDETLYRKTDTHWNLKGAGYGTQTLLEDLQRQHPQLGTLTKVPVHYAKRSEHKAGDLGSIVGLAEDFPVDDTVYDMTPDPTVRYRVLQEEFGEVPNHEATAHGYRAGWTGETENPQAPNHLKVLVICDSFMTLMSQHMNLHFSQVKYVARHFSRDEMSAFIRSYRPNLVIYESIERDVP